MIGAEALLWIKAKHAEMVGKTIFAILIVVIYGIYRIVQEGILPAG